MPLCAKCIFGTWLHQATNTLKQPRLTPRLIVYRYARKDAGSGMCGTCVFVCTERVPGYYLLCSEIICSCFGYRYVKYGNDVYGIVMLVNCDMV